MLLISSWLAKLIAPAAVPLRATTDEDAGWHVDSTLFGLTRSGETVIAVAVRASSQVRELVLSVTVGMRRAPDDRRTVTFTRWRNGTWLYLGIYPQLKLDDVLFVDVVGEDRHRARVMPAPEPPPRAQWNTTTGVDVLEPGAGTHVVRTKYGMRVHDHRCGHARFGSAVSTAGLQHALRHADALVCQTCVPRPPADHQETEA